MNSCVNSQQLQVGVWNKPQIISFDALFSTYSIENVFGEEEKNRMIPILTKWKDLASNHFLITDQYERPLISSYVSPNPKITRRTAHVTLDETPDIIYKTYYPSSCGLHPMATTLRAPMASLIQNTICEQNLNLIGVPKKGLFPLFSKDIISELNEKTINEAFIVCAEKIKAFNARETREIVKELSEESQGILANQCCTLLMKTGLTDCTWDNLQMQSESRKLYVLDTETLEYDLFIDKFGKGFEKCAKAVNNKELSACAKTGLKWFKSSSNVYELEVFENTAASYLEKID